MSIWQELGVSSGTAIVVLFVLYFIIKWAVKNGIQEAYKNITGKKTFGEIETEKLIAESKLNGKQK